MVFDNTFKCTVKGESYKVTASIASIHQRIDSINAVTQLHVTVVRCKILRLLLLSKKDFTCIKAIQIPVKEDVVQLNIY